ncbi:Extracellular exo-alpha-L-arabinofuranosidase precursor [Aquisphaera giovannonii]|uniref:non-reducing end alpha-L-arabinofuranosidase n=1 Tax=Aquisphaera giovannonii TaxID=406548 RepID=A0A5B9VVX2_9BACT|nr:alpha-L-arabinofuranosidase C-terminal domain-containing protein [Aquisphaera giovannonii]QEH32388.1 Extracellular exo-alpha-L-arabinofuranosidase precursor [Aquisphaera giovannonii]
MPRLQSAARSPLATRLAPALAAWAAVAAMRPAAAEPPRPTITVHADRPGHPVSPTLYGIFFEDINCSADGGIYAELVRNRSFEDAAKPEHWTISGDEKRVKAVIDESRPASPKNRRSLKVSLGGGGLTPATVSNEGFWGIPVKEGASYRLSFLARVEGGLRMTPAVSLVGDKGRAYATERFVGLTPEWKAYSCTLRPNATDPKAHLSIQLVGSGDVWLDMVSLFPEETWKGRPGGLRPDLADRLAELRPAFVRFPGGCWVEGDTMKFAYRWKETIGDPSERRTQYNIWNYHATHGLGFHEYLQMCEDLKAEPLFVINCGMSHREVVPMDKMAEFVQDALDAIEYCNGPADSAWGSVRARNGHPAPFHLKYMEIGNENGGPPYQERYALFHDAIRKAHPGITLIANVPTEKRPADVVDEHYYNTPEFFLQQANRYDDYDRKGPKIYVGEYATTVGVGQGNLRGAVGEAAFMLGMERNSDVVAMSSYAPLFVNVNHRGWNPDLINFDAVRSYGIPSFYVQKLFAENLGDATVPVDVQADAVEVAPPGGAVGVGTWLTRAEFKDMKVTRGDEVLWSADLSHGLSGWKAVSGRWDVAGGALRQTDPGENMRAVAGDKNWTDYTFSLKARKLGGAEGFLILFRVRDEGEKSWWNLGGWGNTRHAIEVGGEIGRSVPGRIEDGRWYDIKVDVEGSRIRCYLDGQLVHDVKTPAVRPIHASATRASATGEIILKIVNAAAGPVATTVEFAGLAGLPATIKAQVLSSDHPTDENSLELPEKVAPREVTLSASGSRITHAFPGNSVTVARIKKD